MFAWVQTPAERKFADFDRDNPHVWAMFLRYAEDRIARGFDRYSARDILARMRWETATAEAGKTASGWKLNNNNSSYFARKWVDLGIHPELPGFFEMRRAPKADKEMGVGKAPPQGGYNQ